MVAFVGEKVKVECCNYIILLKIKNKCEQENK